VTRSPELHRNGTVGFIDWLDVLVATSEAFVNYARRIQFWLARVAVQFLNVLAHAEAKLIATQKHVACINVLGWLRRGFGGGSESFAASVPRADANYAQTSVNITVVCSKCDDGATLRPPLPNELLIERRTTCKRCSAAQKEGRECALTSNERELSHRWRERVWQTH
jgi:hypothetical protein